MSYEVSWTPELRSVLLLKTNGPRAPLNKTFNTITILVLLNFSNGIDKKLVGPLNSLLELADHPTAE